jgi:hypothetical protein
MSDKGYYVNFMLFYKGYKITLVDLSGSYQSFVVGKRSDPNIYGTASSVSKAIQLIDDIVSLLQNHSIEQVIEKVKRSPHPELYTCPVCSLTHWHDVVEVRPGGANAHDERNPV